MAILDAYGLDESFSGLRVVSIVSLRSDLGNIHPIFAPAGSGNATLFHLPARFLEPTCRIFHFRGDAIACLDAHEFPRRGMVCSFQIAWVFPELTAIEDPWVALRCPAAQGSPFWPDTATTQALEPQLLLLDEPVQGSGHEGIELIVGLIRRVMSDRSVLVVGHSLGIIGRPADPITAMQRGGALVEAPCATVGSDPYVIELPTGSGRDEFAPRQADVLAGAATRLDTIDDFDELPELGLAA